MIIGIWLFSAVGLYFMAFCAILRIIPGPSLNDRLIAINVAVTLAAAGSLALTVAIGDLIIAVLAMLCACIVFATTIRISQIRHEATT